MIADGVCLCDILHSTRYRQEYVRVVSATPATMPNQAKRLITLRNVGRPDKPHTTARAHPIREIISTPIVVAAMHPADASLRSGCRNFPWQHPDSTSRARIKRHISVAQCKKIIERWGRGRNSDHTSGTNYIIIHTEKMQSRTPYPAASLRNEFSSSPRLGGVSGDGRIEYLVLVRWSDFFIGAADQLTDLVAGGPR